MQHSRALKEKFPEFVLICFLKSSLVFPFSVEQLRLVEDGCQLARSLWIQPIASTLAGMLDDGVRPARTAQEIVLSIPMDLIELGLIKKRTIMVVDVLGQLFHADATPAYIQ